MKKVSFIFIVLIVFAFSSCNAKSPEQRARESWDKRQQEILAEERKADSLMRVAGGIGEYRTMKQNRLNALNELKKMSPGWEDDEKLRFVFEKLESSIQNYE